jgi:hypothetical protein
MTHPWHVRRRRRNRVVLDDRRLRAYVSGHVNLLLVLTALLSALTGASVGARGTQPAVAVAQVAQAAVSARTAVARPSRPAAAQPTLRDVAMFALGDDRPAPALPPFLSRRRE